MQHLQTSAAAEKSPPTVQHQQTTMDITAKQSNQGVPKLVGSGPPPDETAAVAS